MSWNQRDAFLEAARLERPYGMLFMVLAKGGLRPSEAIALKPGDIDPQAETMRVERAWSFGRTKPTKTAEGAWSTSHPTRCSPSGSTLPG